MFSFLKGGNASIPVNDKVWLSKRAKFQVCIKMAEANPACVFIAWFEETRKELKQYFDEHDIKAQLFLAQDLASAMPNAFYIFIEHHPLQVQEQKLFTKLKLIEAPVLSSLDEPIFTLFGGERLVRMMEQLGMEHDEIVGHTMISSAIKRGQKKIEKKVRIEKRAASQQEWFDLNVSS